MTQPPDAWAAFRQLTPARIGLGRAGVSLPTRAHLDFQLAHARARDAVHLALDAAALATELARALAHTGIDIATVRSAARDRTEYLQRPDLGRRLDDASRARLSTCAAGEAAPPDVAFVVADGLSAAAASRHAAPVLERLVPRLAVSEWRIAPVAVAEQGRVALGDEIGELLGAPLALVLLGERPGLSSPDSLGAYLTWAPTPGRRDAERNCVSNIRPEGLGYAAAADRLLFFLTEARRRRLTGIALKDEWALPGAAAGG